MSNDYQQRASAIGRQKKKETKPKTKKKIQGRKKSKDEDQDMDIDDGNCTQELLVYQYAPTSLHVIKIILNYIQDGWQFHIFNSLCSLFRLI
jgi:hypothetical protein